jgi:hypothetical protein
VPRIWECWRSFSCPVAADVTLLVQSLPGAPYHHTILLFPACWPAYCLVVFISVLPVCVSRSSSHLQFPVFTWDPVHFQKLFQHRPEGRLDGEITHSSVTTPPSVFSLGLSLSLAAVQSTLPSSVTTIDIPRIRTPRCPVSESPWQPQNGWNGHPPAPSYSAPRHILSSPTNGQPADHRTSRRARSLETTRRTTEV